MRRRRRWRWRQVMMTIRTFRNVKSVRHQVARWTITQKRPSTENQLTAVFSTVKRTIQNKTKDFAFHFLSFSLPLSIGRISSTLGRAFFFSLVPFYLFIIVLLLQLLLLVLLFMASCSVTRIAISLLLFLFPFLWFYFIFHLSFSIAGRLCLFFTLSWRTCRSLSLFFYHLLVRKAFATVIAFCNRKFEIR